jgi:membrane dipeptidase
MKRRYFMSRFISLVVFILILSACSNEEVRLKRKADRIHETVLTVDSHCDTPMDIEEENFDLGKRHEEGCVDFPRMKEGGLDAEFFAVFTQQGIRNDSSYVAVYDQALRIFEAIKRNVNEYPDLAGIATTPEEAYQLKKTGKIAAFIGVENGYPIGRDISKLKEFYDLGARYMTLAHTRNNDICDSSTDPKGPEHGGLSEFGIQVVNEMNKLGMMIDVSHISDKSFYDVLNQSNAPVIASHSSCRALCENPRNLTDDMLLALKKNGGVIQICILSDYLKTPEPNPQMEEKLKELRSKYGDYNSLPVDVKKEMRNEFRAIQKKYGKLATVKDVVDHIDHVVQVAGIDYVGIGTDFDGGGGVEGCKSVADMKNITVELLRRGYTRADIEKIWGGNIMRVLGEVEKERDLKD